MRRGIVVDENALGHQIGKLFVTFVAQKKRLAAVADENESVMRNSELAHITLQKNDATFTIGTRHSRTKASLHCALSNRQARATLLLRRFNEPSRQPGSDKRRLKSDRVVAHALGAVDVRPGVSALKFERLYSNNAENAEPRTKP